MLSACLTFGFQAVADGTPRARWITGAALKTDSPILEKAFALKAAPKEAVLDIAVAGWCEIRVNGERINDWVMWPVVTDYLTRVPAFKLDVAKFLKAGENEISVQMGNGWFNCLTKVAWGFDRALWIQTPTIRATLVADGVPVAVTDASWRARRSPIVFNQLRNGEFYDARLENSTNVVAATRAPYPPFGAVSYAERNPRPVRAFESFGPVAVVKTEDGRDRYDFGVNLTGWCEIEVEGEAGAKVEIDYNETYGKKGEPYWEIQQYVKSGKAQHDEYTLAGKAGGERWHPRFTYHGFRYAWVKTSGRVAVRAIRARFVHSDLRRVGTLDTDDATFMKLQACMAQSYFSNFVGFPTDCPHREKNGWTGDAALAAETGLWNFDAGDSYRNFLGLALDSQLPNGQVSCILPTARHFGFNWGTGPAWDNVIFELPWQLYRYEGDLSVLEKSYGAQARYLAYVETQLNDEGLMDFGLGDWCAGAQPVTPAVVTSTGYYFQFLRRQAKAARLLGRTADVAGFEAKAEDVRKAFLKAFAKGNGQFGDGLPTTLATPVYFGLVTGEAAKATVERLVEAVRKNGHTCTFGILGAKYVPRVLSDYGYQDDAFELFVQPKEPGYAAIVAKGETTLWESFDGGGSHNHIMFGDFSAWGYEYPGGIRLDESAPGFRHVVLQPRFLTKPGRFTATRELPQGRLLSGWTRNADGSVAYRAELPAGVTATLRLPGRPDETVRGTVVRTVPAK